ncbi:MAG: MFS transporter [Acidobacteria bacterium]|nr:MFS transporter [Acidobacteriota bacterium]
MATDTDDAVQPPEEHQFSQEEHRRILVILFALMLGMFLAALDQSIVSTALPTIAGDLHNLNELSWVVTSYLITSTISLPLWGKLGDLFGRKKLFQVSILIFLAGSILSGLSHSMVQLISFRAIQGIGAGGLLVGSQAIIGDVIPPRQRGRYMGYFGIVFGLSSVLGPLAGGWFTQHVSWRWIFYINLPIGICALIAIALVLRVPVVRVAHQIDYWGMSLLSAGVVCLILVLTWGGTQYAWASSTIIALGLASLVLLVTFCLVELKVSEPIISLQLFSNRTFSAASAVGFVIGFTMFGSIVYLPLYLQVVHGASPTKSGLELLPMVVGMLITFVLSGQLVTRTGRYKIFPILGSAVVGLGLVALSRLGPETSFTFAAIGMFIIGLGLGLVMQVLVVAVQNAVPHSQLGTATATATFFRSIGGAFGVAVLGDVFNNRLLHELRTTLTSTQLGQLVKGGSVAINPSQINRLPVAQRTLVVDAFSHTLQTVFLFAIPFAVIAFALSWLMKEIPLRTQAHVSTEAVFDAPGEYSGI